MTRNRTQKTRPGARVDGAGHETNPKVGGHSYRSYKGWSLQYVPYLELRPGSQFVTVQKLPVTALLNCR